MKRYTISTDFTYGRNRDSCFDNNFRFWIYEDKNGEWVKSNELNELINLPQITKYTICNHCGFENTDLNEPFKYDFYSKNWIKVDINGAWIKWRDINENNW